MMKNPKSDGIVLCFCRRPNFCAISLNFDTKKLDMSMSPNISAVRAYVPSDVNVSFKE